MPTMDCGHSEVARTSNRRDAQGQIIIKGHCVLCAIETARIEGLLGNAREYIDDGDDGEEDDEWLGEYDND